MASTTMSSVDKALALLRHFSTQKQELGLSELARSAGYDKTTTLRCMTALERNGFVEQDPESRKYRVGLAPLSLARIREQSFPVETMLKRHTEDLARGLGETAHATLLMGDDLLTVAISEPSRALRVHLDPSETLPLHATASGIIVTAFKPPEAQEAVLARQKFELHTNTTPTGPEQFRALMKRAIAEGLGRAPETYEADVVGTAAPIFDPSGAPIGSIAVASVASRLTPALQHRIDAGLRDAASDITRELGGISPAAVSRTEEATL